MTEETYRQALANSQRERVLNQWRQLQQLRTYGLEPVDENQMDYDEFDGEDDEEDEDEEEEHEEEYAAQ
jgi:hypothetical protein